MLLKEIKKNYPILLILVISLAVRLIYLSYNIIWWDSSVYIGMAKYIFSLGSSGLWEISRPLALPSILGIFWRLGFDPYITGRVLDLLFSTGCVLLTYLIAKQIFDRRTALLSAFVLSFTPTFFNNGNYLLTEISSTFFALLGLYFLFRKKYLLCGLFCGIAFMTRFLQLFVFIAVFGLLFFLEKKDLLKKIFLVSCGFLIPLLPYLTINYILYNNPIFPFLHQIYMTANTGFIWHERYYFYLFNILKDNFLVVFLLLSPLYYIKTKDRRKHVLLAIFFIFLIFYISIAHKEMRFLITLMPYLSIFVSLGLFYAADFFNKRWINCAAVIVLLSAFFIFSLGSYDKGRDDGRYNKFWDYIDREDVEGTIWVSSPVFAVHSDKKAVPIYYDVFSSEKITELQNSAKPDYILIDTCDLVCPPDDTLCPKMKDDFFNSLKKNFDQTFYEKIDDCERFILSS